MFAQFILFWQLSSEARYLILSTSSGIHPARLFIAYHLSDAILTQAFSDLPKSDLTLAEAAYFYSCYLPEEAFPASLLFTTPSRLAVLTRRASTIRLASQPSYRLTPYLTPCLHSHGFTFSAVLLRVRPKRDSAGGAFMRSRFQSFSIVSSLTALRAGAIRLLRPYLRGCYRITVTKIQPFF